MPLAGAVPLVRDILLLLLHLALPLAPGLLRLQPWRPALRLACLFLLFLLLLLPRGPLPASPPSPTSPSSSDADSSSVPVEL